MRMLHQRLKRVEGALARLAPPDQPRVALPPVETFVTLPLEERRRLLLAYRGRRGPTDEAEVENHMACFRSLPLAVRINLLQGMGHARSAPPSAAPGGAVEGPGRPR
jgi:hypothetical protein